MSESSKLTFLIGVVLGYVLMQFFILTHASYKRKKWRKEFEEEREKYGIKES